MTTADPATVTAAPGESAPPPIAAAHPWLGSAVAPAVAFTVPPEITMCIVSVSGSVFTVDVELCPIAGPGPKVPKPPPCAVTVPPVIVTGPCERPYADPMPAPPWSPPIAVTVPAVMVISPSFEPPERPPPPMPALKFWPTAVTTPPLMVIVPLFPAPAPPMPALSEDVVLPPNAVTSPPATVTVPAAPLQPPPIPAPQSPPAENTSPLMISVRPPFWFEPPPMPAARAPPVAMISAPSTMMRPVPGVGATLRFPLPMPAPCSPPETVSTPGFVVARLSIILSVVPEATPMPAVLCAPVMVRLLPRRSRVMVAPSATATEPSDASATIGASRATVLSAPLALLNAATSSAASLT